MPQEARGGEVAVREGVVLAQPPAVTQQPADATVPEGGSVQLTIAVMVCVQRLMLGWSSLIYMFQP